MMKKKSSSDLEHIINSSDKRTFTHEGSQKDLQFGMGVTSKSPFRQASKTKTQRDLHVTQSVLNAHPTDPKTKQINIPSEADMADETQVKESKEEFEDDSPAVYLKTEHKGMTMKSSQAFNKTNLVRSSPSSQEMLASARMAKPKDVVIGVTGRSPMQSLNSMHPSYNLTILESPNSVSQALKGPFKLNQDLKSVDMDKSADLPLYYQKIRDGSVDVAKPEQPDRSQHIFQIKQFNEKQMLLNKDKRGNPINVKQVKNDNMSDQLSFLNKLVFGNNTPQLMDQNIMMTPHSTVKTTTPYKKEIGLSADRTEIKHIDETTNRALSPIMTAKNPRSFSVKEKPENLRELRSNFTTKGIGLLQPQLNEDSGEAHSGTGSKVQVFQKLPKVRQGFGLANRTAQAATVIIDQPLQIRSPGKVDNLALDQEYITTRKDKIFERSPDNFKQTKSNLDFLKRTVINSASDDKIVDWSTQMASQDQFQLAQMSKALENSNMEKIGKKRAENQNKFSGPIELLSRHPKYLRQFQAISRKNKMNDTLQGSDVNLPFLATYQAFTPSNDSEQSRITSSIKTGLQFKTSDHRGDTQQLIKEEEQTPEMHLKTSQLTSVNDRVSPRLRDQLNISEGLEQQSNLTVPAPDVTTDLFDAAEMTILINKNIKKLKMPPIRPKIEGTKLPKPSQVVLKSPIRKHQYLFSEHIMEHDVGDLNAHHDPSDDIFLRQQKEYIVKLSKEKEFGYRKSQFYQAQFSGYETVPYDSMHTTPDPSVRSQFSDRSVQRFGQFDVRQISRNPGFEPPELPLVNKILNKPKIQGPFETIGKKSNQIVRKFNKMSPRLKDYWQDQQEKMHMAASFAAGSSLDQSIFGATNSQMATTKGSKKKPGLDPSRKNSMLKAQVKFPQYHESPYMIHDTNMELIEKLDRQIQSREKAPDAIEHIKSTMTVTETSGLQSDASNESLSKESMLGVPKPNVANFGLRRSKLQKTKVPAPKRQSLPQIVAEVLQEAQSTGGSLQNVALKMNEHVATKGCSCGVRDFLKEMIKSIRGIDNKLPEYRAEVRKRLQVFTKMGEVEYIKPCIHDFQKAANEERRAVVMKWFDSFQDSLALSEGKQQRLKPRVLREFCKLVLSDQLEFILQDMEKYIVKHDLLRKIDLDYSDFYKFNRYMGIMVKKPKKLKQNQVDKIELDSSEDSSDIELDETLDLASPTVPGSNGITRSPSNRTIAPQNTQNESPERLKLQMMNSNNSIFNINMKVKDYNQDSKEKLIIHEPDQLNQKNIQENHQFDFDDDIFSYDVDALDIVFDKRINIPDKVYHNFLCQIGGAESEMVQIQTKRPQIEFVDPQDAITKEKLEKSLLESFKNTVKAFKFLKQDLDDRAALEQRMKYSSNRNVLVKYVDKPIKEMKEHLDIKIDSGLDTYEKKQSKLERKLNPKPSLSMEKAPSLSPVKKKQKPQTDLYEDKRTNIKFFQEAKRLGGHASDSFKDKDMILARFAQLCNMRQIVPKPEYMHLFTKDRELVLRGLYVSTELAEILRDMLVELKDCSVKQFQVEGLVIDTESIDDHKLAIILEGLVEQDFLKRIILMNCKVGYKSLDFFRDLVTRKTPEEVDEIRLINVKGMKGMEGVLEVLLESIRDVNHCASLTLSYIDLLNQRGIDTLADFISSAQVLTTLDLSHCQLKLPQMLQLVEALSQNETIERLSLRGHQILHLPLVMDTEDSNLRAEETEEIIQILTDYIANSINLQHLDLSGMALGGKYSLKLVKEGISKSQSLLAVHFAQNRLGQLEIEELLEAMGIDYNQVILQIRKSLGSLDKQETLCPGRGGPTDDIKMLNYITDEQPQRQKFEESARRSMMPNTGAPKHYPNKLEEFILHDLEKKTFQKHKAKRMEYQGGEARILEKEFQGRLVLQRKFGYCEQIFNENIQTCIFENYKHFDLRNMNEQWQVRLRDEECYVCNDYVHYQIFYDRQKPEPFFEQIINPFDIKALDFHFRANNLIDKNDPLKNMPLMIGSILDDCIPSARMMQVQHQAMIIWALKEVNDKRTRNPEKKDEELRTLLDTIDIIMADCKKQIEPLNEKQLKDTKDEAKMILHNFTNWRDYVMPNAFDPEKRESYLANEKVLNLPLYPAPIRGASETEADAKPSQVDDGIFIYSGFIKPGKHNMVIYDPVLKAYYKLDNLIVEPRSKSIKLGRTADGIGPIQGIQTQEQHDPIQVLSRQLKGPELQTVQGNLFGDLLYDFQDKIFGICSDNDFNTRSLGLLTRDQKICVKMLLKNYHLIVRLWNLICVPAQSVGEQAAAIAEILELDGNALMDALVAAAEQFKCDGKFERRMMVVGLVHMAVAQDQRATFIEGIVARLEALFVPPLNKDTRNPIQELNPANNFHLRHYLIYENRPLLALLKLNKYELRHKVFQPLLMRWKNNEKNLISNQQNPAQYSQAKYFTAYWLNEEQQEMRNAYIPSSLMMFYEKYILKSIKNLPRITVAATEEGEPEVEVTPEAPDEVMLARFVREAKMNILHQELQGEKYYTIVEFHEWLLLIVLLAIYLGDSNNLKDKLNEGGTNPYLLSHFLPQGNFTVKAMHKELDKKRLQIATYVKNFLDALKVIQPDLEGLVTEGLEVFEVPTEGE